MIRIIILFMMEIKKKKKKREKVNYIQKMKNFIILENSKMIKDMEKEQYIIRIIIFVM